MGTAADITAFLGTLPAPDELIRRVNIVHAIYDGMGTDSDKIDTAFNAHGDTRYFWEDGGGQEANVIWHPGDPAATITLLGYDHESEFNFYDQPDAQARQLALRNLPAARAYLGEDAALFWSWDDSHLVYASCSAWWDTGNQAWTCDSAWLEAADDARDDGGLKYCFKFLTVEPTVDAYVKELMDRGYNNDEAGLRATVTTALNTPAEDSTAAAAAGESQPSGVAAPSTATAAPTTAAAPANGLFNRFRDLFR